jgi:membrane-associated phospholipid phosphatase
LRNLATLRQRLRRVRTPDAPTGARRRRRLVLGGAAIAAVLIVVSLLVLDPHSVSWAQNLSKPVRQALGWVTRFGKSDWLLIPSGVFCVALLFADWSRTGRRVAAAWVELGELAGFFFFSVAFAGITTNLVKWTVGRSRPVLFDSDGTFTFTPLSFDYAHVSFPSGHATTAAAAFMAIALIFRGRWPVIGVAVVGATAIALSRVGVRAHFPSDVVAGLFVGSAFTFLYAHALGAHGVAFQVQADGRLMPKTVAIRRVLRGDGSGALLVGLGQAWFGRRQAQGRDAAAVEKP